MMLRRLVTLFALLVGAALGFTELHSQPQLGPTVLAPELAAAAAGGPVPVIVRLRRNTLPPETDDPDVGRVQQAVSDLMQPVMDRHLLNGDPSVRVLSMSPSFRARLTQDQLLALAADPDVVAIVEDRVFRPSLAQSVPLIGAPTAWGGGLTGTGWTIAILDTGVEKTHPFLANKVVEESCFGTNITGQSQSYCPANAAQSFAVGSGSPCPDTALGCDHGTHVAGIAAGKAFGSTLFNGVAPDAQLVSIQVFSKLTSTTQCAPDPAPCIGAWQSDWEAGIDRVFFIRTNFRNNNINKVGAANLSLGEGTFTSTCENNFTGYTGFSDLRYVNNRIPTVAAAGNDGLANAISSPACNPDVVSVGSTSDASPPTLSSFSNRAPFLNLFAPGAFITSSIPGGSFTPFNGTSMSAPHVSGALTLLRQHAPRTSITNLVATLVRSGEQVTDPANGTSYRMVRIDRALRIPFVSDILSSILTQTNEDTPINIPFSVHDFDTPLNNLSVTVTSSNTAVLPNSSSNIAIVGTGSDRTLRLTPGADQNGTSNVTVMVSDGPNNSESTTFLLTVVPVNDLPTITTSLPSLTVTPGTPGQVNVTLTDGDSPSTALQLSATSLNQVLLPNSNISINPLSTTPTSKTFQVTMTPAQGQEGSSTVTFSATDGTAGGTSSTLNFTFNAGQPAGAPTISTVGPQTTSEGTPITVNFTINDPDLQPAQLGSLSVTASSSNVNVVAAWGLTLGGSLGNRTLTITPIANRNGLTNITLSVSDGSLVTQETFPLTVTIINSAPTITGPTASTTTPGTAVTLTMTVNDIDSAGSSLSLTGESSDTTLLPNSDVVITDVSTGTRSKTYNVTLTPQPGLTGQSTITLTATDDLGATTTLNVLLVVTPTNNAPTISYIPDQAGVPGVPVGPIAFNVSDTETPPASLIVSGLSSNIAVLPNSNIAFAGTSNLRIVTLTPSASVLGATDVTITVSDGAQSATSRFRLTVSGPPPSPPPSVAATARGNEVAVSWTRALTGPAPTSYVVEIGTSPGASNVGTRNTGNLDTSMVFTLPDGVYYIRVRAVNSTGVSAPTTPDVAVVVGTGALIPGPPSNLSVVAAGTSALFTWAAPTSGGPVATYVIEAGFAPGLANIASISTGGATTSFVVPNVPQGTYYIRVRGRNSYGTGLPSSDVAFTMGGGACTAPPGAPAMLAPSLAGSTVTLSWTAPTTGGVATSYLLVAGSASGLSNVAAFDTGSPATTFSSLVPSGTYFVRVIARNACGDSAASNEVSFSAGGAAGAPGAPTGLTASVSAGRVVTFNWIAPSSGGAPSAYILEAGSGAGLSNLATIPTGSTATTFSAPAPPGTFYARVRAVNSAGFGPTSTDVVVVVP